MELRNLAIIAASMLASGLGVAQANAQAPTPAAWLSKPNFYAVSKQNMTIPPNVDTGRSFLVAGLIPATADRNKVIELRGTGAQVYSCDASPSGFDWRLKAPDATLVDGAGAEFGRHFTGPSWQARDGSTVVGEVVASDPAPQSSSIPWLLLRAKSHSGGGIFASVGYIARIRTEGGLAPADGCDAMHTGAERRVPYTAFYVFFSG